MTQRSATPAADARPLKRVLMVCLGNICRSPTAEAVLRAQWQAAEGTPEAFPFRLEVDSAGTSGWHVGKPPDSRSIAHAGRRGYDLSPLRGRRLEPVDLQAFDVVLVMDADNRAATLRLGPGGRADNVFLLGDALPGEPEVPDPYTGGPEGFERVLDLVEEACAAWLAGWRRAAG